MIWLSAARVAPFVLTVAEFIFWRFALVWNGGRHLQIDKQTAQQGVYLKPCSAHKATVEATDPENDPLTYRWEMYYESTETKEGGDEESKPLLVGKLKTINLMLQIL